MIAVRKVSEKRFGNDGSTILNRGA